MRKTNRNSAGCLAGGCVLALIAGINLLLLAAAVWVVKAVWTNS